MRTPCDVAVVGGGPAGATAFAFLARAGLHVVCFERELFSRFHVGESLLPAGLPLFDRLGVHHRLETAGFQRKNGALFLRESDGQQVTLDFRCGPRWEDHAYNAPRAAFDRILLDHAVKEGATVREGVEVRDLAVRDEGVRLTVQAGNGTPENVETGPASSRSSRRWWPRLRACRAGSPERHEWPTCIPWPTSRTGPNPPSETASRHRRCRRVHRPGEFRAARFDAYRRRLAGTALFFEFIERYYDPAFLDVLFAPRPPAMLKDALTTIFAGGAFLEQPLWLRARLACVRLAVRKARRRRRRLGLPVESQLTW